MTSRVLVVEDDHGLRDVVARGLREHGFTVVTAVDGASASTYVFSMVCSSGNASGLRAHHLLCATCSRSRVLSTNRAPGNTERVNSSSSARSSVGQSISLKPTRWVSGVGRSTVSSIKVRKPRNAVSSR